MPQSIDNKCFLCGAKEVLEKKIIRNRVAVSNFTSEGESVLASRALSSATAAFIHSFIYLFYFSYLEVSSGGKKTHRKNKKKTKGGIIAEDPRAGWMVVGRRQRLRPREKVTRLHRSIPD